MEKKVIRKEMLSLRRQLTSGQRLEYSNHITGHIIHLEQFQQSETVYSYVSYQNEVMTDSIIQYALGQGKKVAVPKVSGKKIEFFYIEGMEDLEPGYQGILEPIHTKTPASDSRIFMIMPGLAFDRHYNRIGYGGGYYDRYLEQLDGAAVFKAAVAYDFQVLEQIVSMEYDIKVDCIVTPSCIYQER